MAFDVSVQVGRTSAMKQRGVVIMTRVKAECCECSWSIFGQRLIWEEQEGPWRECEESDKRRESSVGLLYKNPGFAHNDAPGIAAATVKCAQDAKNRFTCPRTK